MTYARDLVIQSLVNGYFEGAPLKDYSVPPAGKRMDEEIITYKIIGAFGAVGGDNPQFNIQILSSKSKLSRYQAGKIVGAVFLRDILADSRQLSKLETKQFEPISKKVLEEAQRGP